MKKNTKAIPKNQIESAIKLHQSGQLIQTERLCRQLLRKYPNTPIIISLLGASLQAQGESKKALQCFNKVLRLEPNNAEVHYNRAVILQSQHLSKDALQGYEKAIEINPEYAPAYLNIGMQYKILDQPNKSIINFKKAIEINHNYLEAHINLGNVLKEQGNFPQAIENYSSAIRINPNSSHSYNNLGATLHKIGELKKANINFNKAIEINPDYVNAHFNLGLLHLLQGDFKNGWKEYEYRYRKTNYTYPAKLDISKPKWDGSSLKEKTLLIYHEQGLGDTIQFSRYISDINRNNGSIIFIIQDTLADLYRHRDSGWDQYIDQIISTNEHIPDYDFHISLMSLPYILNIDVKHISNQDAPYIKVPQKDVEKWKIKINNECKKNTLRVGISWQGSPTNINDRNRSIELQHFLDILNIENVKFFSLQKNTGQKQIVKNSLSQKIVDWSNDFNQFTDTSALIQNLDLVISVDTSIAHISGSMGKPTWVLLEKIPDFRWMLDRKDSPWYPAIKLFRQQNQGDWQTVISEVKKELENLIK